MNINEYKDDIEELYKDVCENAKLATKPFQRQSNITISTEWARGCADALEFVLKILNNYKFEELYFGRKKLFDQQIQCVIDICKEYYRPYDLVSIDELDD